jgi:hypothetical protein
VRWGSEGEERAERREKRRRGGRRVRVRGEGEGGV